MFFSNKPKTNGVYRANLSGYSPHMNESYNLYFFAIFNDNGLVVLDQDGSDEKLEISNEDFQMIQRQKTAEPYSGYSKYEKIGTSIKIKYYDPETPGDYEEGIIHEKRFTEWKGEIKGDRLILRCYKSYFNHALGDYTYEQAIPQLFEFKFETL